MFRPAGLTRVSLGLAAALIAPAAASASPARVPTPPKDARTQTPDLDIVRYRDPDERRMIWLGFDVGGVVLPERLGLFDRRLWTVHGSPSWAVALTDWLTLGGRHSVILYDAVNVRLREHDHQVELSARTLGMRRSRPRMRDRVAVGVSTHAIKKSTVDGLEVKPGGLGDTIVHVSYGISHDLGRRWRLGWQVQARHAWVFRDTQRQVRAAIRASLYPRPAHRLAAEAVAFYVHRDPDQAGRPLPRNSVVGQFAGEWTWLTRYGVGPMLRGRLLTTFRSGEAPAYEIREEALNNIYGEAIVGVRAVWR